MALVPIRNNYGYVGVAKQASQGVPLAPTLFPRWQDGSGVEIDGTFEDVWEGDTSRHLSLIIKNGQKYKLKLTFAPRPIELGFFEAATMGAASDTVTAATVSTTLSAPTIVGATLITVAANTGLTGSGTIVLILEPGTATEEIAIFTIPVTGAGPYTANVNASYNGGQLRLAHANAGVVRSQTSHALTDQSDGSYYTFEVSLGGAVGGIIMRMRDCKIESCKRGAKAGGLLIYELEIVGIACVTQVSASTVTLEAHSPFLFTQGVWTLDGSTSGDAVNISMFDIVQKNNLDTTIQTEQLTLAAIIFGSVAVDVSLEVIYSAANTYIQKTYFGGVAGTSDAQATGTGSVLLTFTAADSFHVVTFNVQALTYTKAEPPKLKKDGKAFRLPLQASSTSNQGALTNVLQTTVQNAQTAAY